MKLSDVETCIKDLKDLRDYGNSQDYNTTSIINKHLNNTLALLEKEKQRLNNESIEIEAPQIKIVHLKGDKEDELAKVSNKELDLENLTYQLNQELQELVSNDKKIIDFGYLNTEEAYIKYNL